MTAPTPAQAGYEALHASIRRRQPAHLWVAWDAVNEINGGIPGEPLREDWEAAVKAAMDAAVQGLLAVAGTTLDEVTAAVMGVVGPREQPPGSPS